MSCPASLTQCQPKRTLVMSDHFSGPRAIAGPLCDICDVYAFPSPERPGRLVLVMNVLPLAKPGSLFSESIVCRFRIRPVTTTGPSSGAAFRAGDREIAVD